MTKLVSISGLAAAAVFAFAGSASAADMPVKAPPVVVAPYDWSGLYVGFHEGYEWGRFQDSYVPPFANLSGTSTTAQPIVGFHAGLQKQFGGFGWGNIVLGVEGGLNAPVKPNSFSNFIAASCGNPAAFTCGLLTVTDNWYAGGRGGLAFNVGSLPLWLGGDYLLTVSGGWTTAIFHREDPANGTLVLNNGGQTLARHNGAYVGVGLEHVLAKGNLVDWIAGVDYQHEFYGNQVDIDAAGFGHNQQLDLDIIRLRTTLKFK